MQLPGPRQVMPQRVRQHRTHRLPMQQQPMLAAADVPAAAAAVIRPVVVADIQGPTNTSSFWKLKNEAAERTCSAAFAWSPQIDEAQGWKRASR